MIIKGNYFADGAGIILTDDSHLVDTTITDGLMVALTNSYEFGLFSTQYAFLFSHFVVFVKNIVYFVICDKL